MGDVHPCKKRTPTFFLIFKQNPWIPHPAHAVSYSFGEQSKRTEKRTELLFSNLPLLIEKRTTKAKNNRKDVVLLNSFTVSVLFCSSFLKKSSPNPVKIL